jgi:hypothetical protein
MKNSNAEDAEVFAEAAEKTFAFFSEAKAVSDEEPYFFST